MARILARWVTTAIALAVAAWFFDGIYFDGPSSGRPEIEEKILPLLLVAAILALLTSWVKPVLTFISIPLILLTLGLFLLVVNAAVLALSGKIADGVGIDFHVDGFWTAVGGAIVITIVTWIVDGFVGDETRH